jgi:hypothetical protein
MKQNNIEDIVAEYIKNENISYLNDLLFDNDNQLKILPYEEYKYIPINHLRKFALLKGIYSFPTIELVSWIKDNYDVKNMIEIGCGNGVLAKHLKIPATDANVHEYADIRLTMELLKLPTIRYPHYVEKLTAMEAIDKYKPKTVLACWCSQLYDMKEHYRGGSIYGIDEEKLLKKVDNYVFIGNKLIHGKKKILKIKHNTLKPYWLVSRSKYPQENLIYTWEKYEYTKINK